MNLKAMNRLREVVSLLFKYEMHHVIDSLELKMHLPLHKRFEPKGSPLVTQPEILRNIFEELGGAFIKLGQLLALRPDLVGEKYSKEFERLLDNVLPEEPQVIRDIIRKSGLRLARFDEKPLGSASVAEVHKAEIGGKEVAVKIKRPGIDEKFSEDIQIMEFLARRIKEHYKLEFIDPVEIVEEFKKYTQKELSLREEALNIRRIHRNFQGYRHIKIPNVYLEYSSENILVMEYVKGRNILSAKSHNRGVIKRITEAVYKMLFEDRFFHADLHPGNIFIEGDTIIFLDFGIVGHIDKELEKKLFKLFSGLIDGNLDRTADALLELNVGTEEPNMQLLKEGIYDLFGSFYDTPLKSMDFSRIFYGSIDFAKTAKIKLPSQIVLFGKSLVTMDGFCRQIDPEFNVVRNAKPYVRKLIAREMSVKSVLRKTRDASAKMYEILTDIPDMAKSAVRKIARLENKISEIDATFQLLARIVWRVSRLLTATILFATFFVSSIILLDRPPTYHGYSLMSIIGFAVSFFLLLNIIGLLDREEM